MSKRLDCKWYVYLLSNSKGILYCGVTTDIQRRLNQHNGIIPGGAKFTRGRGPWHVKCLSQAMSQSEACKVEREVKKKPKAEKVSYLKEQI